MSYYSDVILAESNLVSYWILGEPSSTFTDSKDSNPGSIVGSGTRGAASLLPYGTDLSLTLGGSGNVSVADAANLDLGDGPWTLECWIKPSGSFAGTPVILSKQTNAYNIQITSGGKLAMAKSGIGVQVTGATTLVAGTTYHVAATKSGAGVAKVFVNGVEDASASPGVALADNASALNIGADIGTANRYSGTIQHVAIYNTNKSAAELLAHTVAGNAAVILPPIATATTAGLVPAVSASSTVEPPIASAAAAGLAPTVSPDPAPPATIAVKERPPDDAALYVENPDGSERRIAGDEPFLPLADYTIASTLPGGFSTADGDAVLPRQGIETLQKFSRVSVRHSDRTPLWEGRLESTPQRSEDGTLGIAAVGHQALLLDNPGIVFLGVDNDMTAWEDPPGDYLDSQAAASHSVNSRFTLSTGENVLSIGMDAEVNVASSAYGVAWYLPPMGQVIGTTIQYIAQEVGGTNMALTMATSTLREDISTLTSATVDTSGTTVKTLTSTTGGLAARVRDTPTTNPVNKTVRIANFYAISVFGNHGLPMRDVSSTLPQGLYLSDIVPYLLAQYAPLLATTKGGESTIESSTYAMASAVWRDPTTLGQIIEDGLAFEPDRDWAVWEGPTFHMGSRQSIGRTWTVRRSEGAVFHDLGETSEPDYNGVVVTYTDGDGSTKRVGPPGSGADTEDASLADTDPENPVNASSVLSNRYKLIDLGDSTSAAAISVGQVALSEALRRRFSGEVELPRYALREGQLLPTNMMRAGDRIIDGDSLTGEEMLLVEASYQRSAVRPMRATVDTPANRLDSEIARIAGRPGKLNRRKVRRFHRRARRARTAWQVANPPKATQTGTATVG